MEQITLREASRVLGVHVNTVRRWAHGGLLTDVRVPGTAFLRLSRAEVENLARLRAETGGTSVEWGVRWNRVEGGTVEYLACDDRAEAEEMIRNDDMPWLPETNPTLVRRIVTTWQEAD